MDREDGALDLSATVPLTAVTDLNSTSINTQADTLMYFMLAIYRFFI